ncbi:MAG: transferrin-binding protein-like solute binding protein [Croceibacterium sp.]
MKQLTLASLIVFGMVLASCGGNENGGTSIASAPPPVPAVPSPAPAPVPIALTSVAIAPIPSPATRPGTTDAIALIEQSIGSAYTYRLASPSEVRVTTYQAGPAANDISYTIAFTAPELPGNRSSLTAVISAMSIDVSPTGTSTIYRDGTVGKYPIKFGDALTATNTYPDGTQKIIASNQYRAGTGVYSNGGSAGNNYFTDQIFYNVGLSYVSLGQWIWESIVASDDEGAAYFVHGDRTPAAEIPTSGSATYSAASLAQISIELTADFGKRSIAAQLNREYSSGRDISGGFNVNAGVDLRGTGPITSDGSFFIPLTGTISFGSPGPATGSLNGAFFGPNAAQVGGVFAAGPTSDVATVSDAFVGLRN